MKNVLVALLAVASLPGAAADRKGTEAAVSRSNSATTRVVTPQVERTVRDTREVVKAVGRSHIENSTQSATNARLPVTSRDRSGPLQSPAHDRGAVDFGVQRSRDPHRDAQAIARAVGPGHKAIVEEPGYKRDMHTSYTVSPVTGQIKSNTYIAPHRATGTHIHVQPEYEIKRIPPRDDVSKYRDSLGRWR